MTVDEEIIRSRLIRLNGHLCRIEQKRPEPLSLILTDPDLQDILSHNLEKAVQVCIDIASHVCVSYGRAPQTAGDSFHALSELGLIDRTLADKMISAVGFRNVSVHEYAAVDWKIVMKIVADGTEDLNAFGRWAASLVTLPQPAGSRI